MVGAGIGPGHYQRAAVLTERYGVEVTPEQVFSGDLPYDVEVAIAAENGTTPPAPPATTGAFDEDALEARLEEINPDSDTWHWDSQFAASTPDAVIDALDAASDGNPEMDRFLQTLRENPEMAQALQQALAQEGGDLLGTIEDLARGTNSEFSLESLNAALETEDGRNLFTNALELMAENEIGTGQFENVMSSFHGANGHEGRFLAALDPSKSELLTIINGGTGLLGTDEAGLDAAIRDLISERTAGQLMEAVSAAYPDSEVIGLIAADTELSEAIHAVVVAEPDALEGFQNILGATDENAFTAEDLEGLLNNPIYRNALTDVLEVVAENDEFTFAHVTQLMTDYKNNDQQAIQELLNDMGVTPSIDFGDFFQNFMENPELAINDLVNMLVDTGQIPAEMGDTIRGFAIPMGNLMQGMIQPYHEVAMRHDFSISAMLNGAEERGREYRETYGGPTVNLPGLGEFPSDIFVAEVGDAELGTFDVEQIQADFATALEGVDLSDHDAVTAALREALPEEARDEFDGITTSTDLNGQFTAAMFGGTPDAAELADRAAEFSRGLQQGAAQRLGLH